MKKILKGDEAIEAYIKIQDYTDIKERPLAMGFFNSSDAGKYGMGWDENTIVAFDNSGNLNHIEGFDNKQDAEDWILH